MADQPKNTFIKGLNKDLSSFMLGTEIWIHAKNLVNNSNIGDQLTLSTEAANRLCITLPYKLIGAICLEGSQWVVFTTDNTHSEIGIIDLDLCSYSKLANSSCLGFKTTNLITGAARRNFDCGFSVYWSDGALNPDRVLDTNNIPWVQNCVTDPGGCVTCTNTSVLDCDKLRIAPLLTIPCLSLNKSKGSGTLGNGTYQVAIAYAVNEIKVTDYIALSNPQAIFSHNNEAGAVTLNISNADTNFDEMEVVLISYINGQLTAKRLGIYDTRETTIYISNIDLTLPNIDISLIPLQTTKIEKSDSIWNVNNYLLRSGVYTTPEINYQPQANNIIAKWAVVEYPEDYYKQGGNNYSYQRDEQYVFFIRWVLNTGDKTASYPIPGTSATFAPDWRTRNTATVLSRTISTLPDGGVVLAKGNMGYWESTEKYPDNKSSVWGSLCGKPIRHHKFPDQTVDQILSHFNARLSTANTIDVLGVYFENITHPLDLNGNPITNIVGYEILRGSREGNKSIIAKGMLNNMRSYTVPGTQKIGLYQNYPANDLRPDKYLSKTPWPDDAGDRNNNPQPLDGYRKDMFSFHSPDTSFQHPFLGSPDLKLYQNITGISNGYFQEPYRHPLFKVPTNFTKVFSDIAGISGAINVLRKGMALGSTDELPISYEAAGLRAFPTPPNAQIQDPLAGASTGGGTDLVTSVPNIIFQYTKWTTEVLAWIEDTAATIAFAAIMADATSEKIMEVIRALIPGRQYALQFNSHAFYNQPNWIPGTSPNITRQVSDYQYVEGQLQSFNDFSINNLYRNNYVLLSLSQEFPDPSTWYGAIDNSRYTLSEVGGDQSPRNSTVSSYYGGVKVDLPAQYGQIGSVRQLPISCVYSTTPNKTLSFSSPILFGGDTYINRYTEKNPFLFFNDWLVNVTNDFQYDYRNYTNIPYPCWWIDNQEMHQHLLQSVSKNRHLDYSDDGPALSFGSPFYVNRGSFYLFCNGVRDFFVESDVNVGYRDWGETTSQRFYDPYGYTDIDYMFRSDVIKSDAFYKYDWSLSVNKFYTQYISFGQILDRDYDPYLAYTCFQYMPRRVAYSLPQSEELKRDNWRQFLPNNFDDFPTPIRAIKSISKTGALFLLDEESPVQLLGVQTFQSGELGKTQITVGDGGLFNQPLQSVSNVDKNIQYGSCKSRMSVINTPYGVFWVSQKSGKVFQYSGGGMEDISKNGMKWWFSKYLPSYLVDQFPNFVLYDNPVAGVGVQTSYDATNEILYISKKDCKLKDEYLGIIHYDPNFGFYYNDGTYTCPDGYSLSGTTCTLIVPATLTSTPYKVAPSTLCLYGQGTQYTGNVIPGHLGTPAGTIIYNAGFNKFNGTGTFNIIDSTNDFWFWNVPPSGCTNFCGQGYTGACDAGQVNRIMVWNDDGLTNYDIAAGGNRNPVDTWIGFTTCLTIPKNGTYYIAIAADNEFRVTIDGNLVVKSDADQLDVQMGSTSQRATWLYLHIYPVALTIGTHTITMEARNVTGSSGHAGLAGFGVEIYDNTSVQIQAARSYADLNSHGPVWNGVIFTTRDQTVFNNSTYACPQGYTQITNPAPCTAPECKQDVPATLKRIHVEACDPIYFEDASFTISYDLKNRCWLSFHSWNPDYTLSSTRHNLSTKGNGLWEHNDRTDLFANFYGTDYPTELAYPINTGIETATLRNIEYYLEAFSYGSNEWDRFQQYSKNWDQLLIWNDEQISGWLNLNPKPTNPYLELQYPNPGAYNIAVLYSMKENLFKVNSFWDITNDRGEFTNSQQELLITDLTGTNIDINPFAVDYQKPELQRKKFRNYNNIAFFRKRISDYIRFNIRINSAKHQKSSR